MSDNVIELRDRELVRENLVREPGSWEQLKRIAGELARKILGPPHDAERCAVCAWCRKSGRIGDDVELVGIYAHPRCAGRIELRSREPLNVWEDLTAIVSVVLVAGVAIMLVIEPAIRWLVGVPR